MCHILASAYWFQANLLHTCSINSLLSIFRHQKICRFQKLLDSTWNNLQNKLFHKNQFNCILPDKVVASLISSSAASYSSKLVSITIRRPKGPPLRFILILRALVSFHFCPTFKWLKVVYVNNECTLTPPTPIHPSCSLSLHPSTPLAFFLSFSSPLPPSYTSILSLVCLSIHGWTASPWRQSLETVLQCVAVCSHVVVERCSVL